MTVGRYVAQGSGRAPVEEHALIQSVLPDVETFIYQLWREGARWDMDEVRSAVYEAVVRAAKRYTPSKGSFRNYAWLTMRHALKDWQRSTDHLARSTRRAIKSGEREDGLPGDAPALSFETPTTDDGMTLGGLIPAPEGRSDERVAMLQLLRTLPERQRLIVCLYWYADFTHAEIGVLLGVTESRVSQLHKQARSTLRDSSTAEEMHA